MNKVFISINDEIQVGDKIIKPGAKVGDPNVYYRVLEIIPISNNPIVFWHLLVRDHVAWAYQYTMYQITAEEINE